MQPSNKILVTGADGFIGSHLVEALVEQGYDVRAFVMYNSMNSWGWLDSVDTKVLQHVEVVAGDIRDHSSVSAAVRDCDAVLHLAALIAIPFSYHAPASYVDTNIKGTLNICQAVSESGRCKLIHTSTSEVYGSAQTVPISEHHPLVGQSPYAATKIGADQIALSFNASFGIPVTVIRPFNTYGPRQSYRAVIPTVISQIAAGFRELKLGATFPTRDFNYVQDTVRGFICALKADTATGKVVNIGSGFEISIADTVKTIARLMGSEVTILEDAIRLRPANSEVTRLVADNSRAAELLAWHPEFAGLEGLERGLHHTINWFLDEKNRSSKQIGSYTV
jgi:NAD dependent epimerase/dehydratase